MMNKMLLPLLLSLLASCSQNQSAKKLEDNVVVNHDSLLIENLLKQQKNDLANKKIDSILPLKPLKEQGYYYFQKGVNCLMLEQQVEAISNFEQAIKLGYEVKASEAMIETAKEMKKTYDEYN